MSQGFSQHSVSQQTTNDNNKNESQQASINGSITEDINCDKQIITLNNNIEENLINLGNRLSVENKLKVIENDEIITVFVSDSKNNNENETKEIIVEISDFIEDEKKGDNEQETPNPHPKSILSNGGSPTEKSRNSTLKKSVSFDTNEECVKKFVDGEEIVDQKNPFKQLILEEPIATKRLSKKSRLGKKTSTPFFDSESKLNENEFVTKEDVLKQSKYVTTYIKNPDKILNYDKSVLEKISSIKKSRLKKTDSSKIAKRSPVPTPRTSKLPQAKSRKEVNATKAKRYREPENKYPDLADLKVKTGTDLEESLYDSNEVAINVLKFDSRFRRADFGSQDDIDEIADITSSNTTCDEKEDDENSDNPDETKTFTNTVTSNDFKEYLKKKGLSLVVKRSINNSTIEDEMDKSEKKPSMLRRIFYNGLFSSKSKTTPKEDQPQPLTPYTKSHVSTQDAGSRRVVLERASFNAGSNRSSVSANNEFTKQFSMRDKTRRSLNRNDNDRTSSISSILTAAEAEDYVETNVKEKNPTKLYRQNYVDMKQKLSVSKKSQKENFMFPETTNVPIYRSIDMSRARQNEDEIDNVNTKVYPINFEQNSPELGKGVIRPKVQRPNIPISSLKLLPNNQEMLRQSTNASPKPPVPLRRSSERSSLMVKSTISNDNTLPNKIKQTLSMDRNEIKRRSNINRSSNNYDSSAMIKSVPAQVRITKAPIIYNENTSTRTPTNSNEHLIDGPTKTSTPKTEKDMENKMKSNISPIRKLPETTDTNGQAELNPYTYIKLHELKKKTDEELYSKAMARPLPINKNSSIVNHQLQRKTSQQSENIYETTPVYHNYPTSSIQYDKYGKIINEGVFSRNSVQRNTISGDSRYKAVYNYLPQKPVQQYPVTVVPQTNIHNNNNSKQAVYGAIYSQPSRNSVPEVIKRRDSLDKNQILKEIYDFYRRSVSNTPTQQICGSIQRTKSSAETSPISYASVDTRTSLTSNFVTPEVPKRIQSLNAQHQQIIPHTSRPQYREIISTSSYSPKRVTFNGQTEYGRTGRRQTYSDSDSVFLPDNNTPRRFVVMDSEKITPVDVMKYGTLPTVAHKSAIYGRTGPPTQPKLAIYNKEAQHSQNIENLYAYVQKNISRSNQNLLERPASVMQVRPQIEERHYIQHPATQMVRIDGRTTPLVLHSLSAPRQRRSIDHQNVYGNAKQPEQIYSRTAITNQNRTVVMFNSQELLDKRSSNNLLNRENKLPLSVYESESGSEAEVQNILQSRKYEEDWQNDKSSRNQQNDQSADDRRRAARSREDPRRHTLGGDMLHYTQGQGGTLPRSMDLEAPPMRSYTPTNQGPLFDDDPGIMSEVETASTGFRRGGKQRSSLPVVRTPSKTLERPLGLVFLQYRSETKRALLPNEITSIDTVRALFVRSFPRQLTMAYLEGPNVKIYIHDSSKDMFYELEDVRSHLREIRDRSVLRLFESNEVGAPQVLPGGPGVPQPLPPSGGSGHWDQDQSYFSEPEFDSEYQHQHIHKSKTGKGAYYVGAAQTLPRGMYSDRNKNAVDGYMSSPERGTRGSYEEPYYSQYGTRGNTVTPIIDEEQGDVAIVDDQYSMYGVKGIGRLPRAPNQMYDPTRPEDLHRIRVEHMERQLANLTGLVQKALIQAPVPTVVPNQNYLGVPGQYRGDKSVSFEKSVSFSDDIQGAPKSHSPQHLGKSLSLKITTV